MSYYDSSGKVNTSVPSLAKKSTYHVSLKKLEVSELFWNSRHVVWWIWRGHDLLLGPVVNWGMLCNVCLFSEHSIAHCPVCATADLHCQYYGSVQINSREVVCKWSGCTSGLPLLLLIAAVEDVLACAYWNWSLNEMWQTFYHTGRLYGVL